MTVRELKQLVTDAGYTIVEQERVRIGLLTMTIEKDGKRLHFGILLNVSPEVVTTALEWIEGKRARSTS